MERIAYTGHGDARIPAHWTHPGGIAPAVLLIHGAGGLGPDVEQLAARLADAGFASLAPDLGAREGDSASPLPDRRALSDLEAGFRWLVERSDVAPGAPAVLGVGQGGTLAFLLACTRCRPSAVVDFWGPVVYPELSADRPAQPLELALNLPCPALFHFGTEDPAVPPEQIAALETALTQFAMSFELELWEGAGSGFLWSGRPGYHEPSARAAWDRTLRFLREQLETD